MNCRYQKIKVWAIFCVSPEIEEAYFPSYLRIDKSDRSFSIIYP
ncbi:hypothetical protein [Nostoc sp.]